MPLSYIHFAFTAGELSPALHGRADIEKFDLGLRLAKNWLVDYTGGVTVRPGTKFLHYIKGNNVRFVPFTFNLTSANSYLILFHDGFIRFVQDDGYVLEAAQTVSAVSGNDLTITAHGYAVGDWLWLGTDLFEVTAVPDANTVTVSFVGPAPGPDISSTTSAQRVYTIPGPAWNIVKNATFNQFRDEVWICSLDAAPQKLIRAGHTNWSITTPDFSNNLTSPTIASVTPSTSDNRGGVYAVTAVDQANNESPIFTMRAYDNLADVEGTTHYNTVNWVAVSGAIGYNVYRSVLVQNENYVNPGMMLGWQSFERGSSFVDQNVVPDFQKGPRFAYNPFAPGAVQTIDVTAQGTGYSLATTMSITSATGSGFRGAPIIENGKIVAAMIIDPGSGYDPDVDTIVFSDGTGTGAAATFTASASTGIYPASTTVHDSRRIFGGTSQIPVGIFASRLGAHEDFSKSQQINDADPFELLLDGPELAPIRHLASTPFGLLAATDGGIYSITSSDGSGLTASNAIARPLERSGVHDVPPLLIEDTVLYVRARSDNVQLLRRGPQNTIQSQDISLFSRHLFGPERQILSWAWALIPQRQLWAIREDGRANVCALLPSQNVYAWTWAETDGRFIECAAVRRANEDALYLAVRRNGRLLLERLEPKAIHSIDDAFGLDSFLATTETPGTGDLTIGSDLLTSSASDFANAAVGDQIRWQGWRWTITAVNSPTEVAVTEELSGADLPPDNILDAGDWTIVTPTSSVQGLWHMEGETVNIFADGQDMGTATVSNGAITLPAPAGRIVVGKMYSAEMETLPVKVLKNQRGRALEVVTRLQGANSLEVRGKGGSWLKPANSRGDAREYSLPAFGPVMQRQMVLARWDEDAGISLRKSGPFRAAVLGLEVKMETPQG